MDARTYEAVRRAARRSGKSFNTYAVEKLEAAANPGPVKKIRIRDLKPDPELES